MAESQTTTKLLSMIDVVYTPTERNVAMTECHVVTTVILLTYCEQ